MKDLGKKRLLIIAGGIIGIVILITIILLIYNAIFGKVTYKDIENKVLNAAKKYYSENESLLPRNESEQVSITDANLTAAGYLTDMNKLTSKMKGVTCTATVMVSYAGGNYRYTPLLDCGENYSAKTLTAYIKANTQKVYDGSGLYDLNGELVYRGEDPDNYVKFAGHNWRIVKIENDQIMMILDEKSEKSVWDDRFNSERNRSEGINDYRVSRIYELLSEMYEKDTLIGKNYKSLIAVHNLYIGKRYEMDMYNDGTIEKAKYFENQYIGLLPLYDYINASIDTNCTSSLTHNCSNYNYLNHYDYNWWTITANASNTYKVFRIDSYGTIETIKAASNGYVRPIIYLAKDALYAGGTGTVTDPYTIK